MNKKFMHKQGILFINLDECLLPGNLQGLMCDALVEKGVWPKLALFDYKQAEEAWRKKQLDYEDYISAVQKAHDEFLAGTKIKHYEKVAQITILKNHDRKYFYTDNLLKEKSAQDWQIIGLSVLPGAIAEKVARQFNIQEVISADYEIIDGIFTSLIPEAINSGATLMSIMRRPEFGHIIKDNVWAIGSLNKDMHYLDLAGKAICFNPKQSLLLTARKNGWQVVVEKDGVEYEFTR